MNLSERLNELTRRFSCAARSYSEIDITHVFLVGCSDTSFKRIAHMFFSFTTILPSSLSFYGILCRQLDAQIYALVSSTALGALYLDQASSIGCLQSTVEAMNVTEIAYSTER